MVDKTTVSKQSKYRSISHCLNGFRLRLSINLSVNQFIYQRPFLYFPLSPGLKSELCSSSAACCMSSELRGPEILNIYVCFAFISSLSASGGTVKVIFIFIRFVVLAAVTPEQIAVLGKDRRRTEELGQGAGGQVGSCPTAMGRQRGLCFSIISDGDYFKPLSHSGFLCGMNCCAWKSHPQQKSGEILAFLKGFWS